MILLTRAPVPRVAQASGLWDSASRRILLRAPGRARFSPNSEIERGAHPPRVLFSAPSRKTRAHRNISNVQDRIARQLLAAGRDQRRPGRACSPTSEFGFNPALGTEDALPDFGGTPKSTRGTRVLP